MTEALHKGTPIIAYNAGGIPLQISHSHNGFLIPVGDIPQGVYIASVCNEMPLCVQCYALYLATAFSFPLGT